MYTRGQEKNKGKILRQEDTWCVLRISRRPDMLQKHTEGDSQCEMKSGM
jgi:hypothetical protein